jgi:A/G-specific adenine glycosylase
MLGWPGSDWGDTPGEDAPIRAEWKTIDGEARHTFTHFHLRLTVRTALVPMERAPDRGEFIEMPDFRPSDLPTVMRKAFDLAQGS